MTTINDIADRSVSWGTWAARRGRAALTGIGSWTERQWNRPGRLGSGIRMGVLESFGIHPHHGILGSGFGAPGRMAGYYKHGRKVYGFSKLGALGYAAKEEFTHLGPASFRRAFLGRGAKGFGKAAFRRGLGPILGGYFTYDAAVEGYRESGIIGAVTGTATQVAINTAFSVGLKLLGGTLGAALGYGALAAGVGYGGYKALDVGASRTRRLRGLELGHGLDDQFGNIATMRQRSLQQMQNTHLNTRSLLGTEAQWMHLG